MLATLFTIAAIAIAIYWYLSSGKSTEEPVSFNVTVPEQADPTWQPTEFTTSIHDGFMPNALTCYDPCTGGVLDRIKPHTSTEINEMLEKARVAQKSFKLTTFAKRRAVLQSLAAYIVRNQGEICRVSSRDTGKTFVDGFFGEILTTLEKIKWLCAYGEETLRDEYRPVGALTMHKLARVEYHPRGVVSAVVSWNYPFHNTFGPVISALFAGNAILIKPSEYVAWSAVRYYERILHACLEKHGLSSDLVRFVIGEAAVGRELVTSGVDKVTFIGSPQVGKAVMRDAADRLTPVVLELGGKDAAVLCKDCDLGQVVPIIMRGTFQNMGQNCVGLEKVVVHDEIYEAFLEDISQRVSDMSQGQPLAVTKQNSVDCGAITMPKQLKHIQTLVDDAVREGAKLLCGGKIVCGKGQFFEPTVLANVSPNMRIAKEEVFGPVMSVMRFNSDQEAVNIVNATPYGLGCNVFSADIQRAERILAQIETGMGNVNDFAVNYLCQSLPFGGVKSSGFGRFGGVEGLRGECRVKAVTVDRFDWLKTRIPHVLDYPMRDGALVEKFCTGLSTMIYGDGIKQRLGGLKELVAAATK